MKTLASGKMVASLTLACKRGKNAEGTDWCALSSMGSARQCYHTPGDMSAISAVIQNYLIIIEVLWALLLLVVDRRRAQRFNAAVGVPFGSVSSRSVYADLMMLSIVLAYFLVG